MTVLLDPVTNEKACGKCKRVQSAENFSRNKACVDGLMDWCRECNRGHARAWRENSPENYLTVESRRRAQRKSIPHTLTATDVHIPDDCPVCGYTLKAGGWGNPTSPSIDAWIPALGYTKENAWVICHDCNRRKSSTPGDELIAFAFKCVFAFKEFSDASL